MARRMVGETFLGPFTAELEAYGGGLNPTDGLPEGGRALCSLLLQELVTEHNTRVAHVTLQLCDEAGDAYDALAEWELDAVAAAQLIRALASVARLRVAE